MRVAATVERESRTVVGLPEADELVIWDTITGEEWRRPSLARELTSGRRLAAIEALLAEQAEVICTVPLGFCTASYAIAQARGLHFLTLEVGTPTALIEGHLAVLAMTAQAELPASWLAAPAARPVVDAPETDRALPLSDAAAQALINRLKRLEGQARGVQRLIAERRNCEQITTQLSAMRAALNAIGVTLLAENLAACLATAEPEGHRAVEVAKRAFHHLS